MTTEIKRDGHPAPTPELKLSRKKQLLFSALIFVAFFLLLEGALTLLGIPAGFRELNSDNGPYRRTKNIQGSRYKPGWSGYYAGAKVSINSAGWRGKEFSPDKSPGTFRILGVGDSMTFGKAVDDEDTFLAKLEQMLNEEGGLRYETINTGEENLSTADELTHFRNRQMITLKPDVVVLGFTVQNDAQPKAKQVKNRKILKKEQHNATLALRIAESRWFDALADISRTAAILQVGAHWASQDRLNEIYSNLLIKNYEEGSKAWEACRAALLGLHEECRKHNLPLVLAVFPVYTKTLDQPYNDYPEAFKRIQEQVKAVLAGKEGVVVVDVLDDLAATGLKIRDLRVPSDGHPNRIWHEIVARRLKDVIHEMQLKSAAGQAREAGRVSGSLH